MHFVKQSSRGLEVWCGAKPEKAPTRFWVAVACPTCRQLVRQHVAKFTPAFLDLFPEAA